MSNVWTDPAYCVRWNIECIPVTKGIFRKRIEWSAKALGYGEKGKLCAIIDRDFFVVSSPYFVRGHATEDLAREAMQDLICIATRQAKEYLAEKEKHTHTFNPKDCWKR